MIKECEYCKMDFVTNNNKRKFCSHICSNKHMWSNKEIREKICKSIKDTANTQESKERFSNISKEYQNRPDVKKQKSIRQTAWHAIPENKEKIKKYFNSEDALAANSKHAKEYQNRPDVKEKQSKFQKEYQNRPDVKEANKQRSINMWNDLERSDLHMKSCYKYKDYTLPSGKIVKIQGYEPQALTELLNIFLEEDIVIGVKEINKEIGQIKYMYENNDHTYYPDFYIKSINTIIEVKSQWTFNKHKEKNLAKEKACIEQGFSFEFKII